MLKDRRVLLEQEIHRAHDQAAHMYLDIVVKGENKSLAEYQLMRDKISKLEFDLNMLNQLIHKGHE